MKHLRPEKLHVCYLEDVGHDLLLVPRRYTLTHSDLTGDIYLSISSDYNSKQVSYWYTRFMRDEVLAGWKDWQDEFVRNVHCHVSGGLVFGWAALRACIFRHELPLMLQALCFGDGLLFGVHPELDFAPVWAHFHAKQPGYNVQEMWGKPADYSG